MCSVASIVLCDCGPVCKHEVGTAARNRMNASAQQLESILALLGEQCALSLATVDAQGLPCVAPLNYIFDADLALYWLSASSSQHSANLQADAHAAVTVYRRAANWKEICGVQMRGRATAVSDGKLRRATIKRYCERFQLGTLFRLAIARCTLYRFQPDFVRYLDNGQKFGFRFELDLSQPER